MNPTSFPETAKRIANQMPALFAALLSAVPGPPALVGMRHALRPPVRIVSRQSAVGAQWKAQAWYSRFYHELRYRITATGTISRPYLWDWKQSRVVPEWEPPAFRETDVDQDLQTLDVSGKPLSAQLDGFCLFDYYRETNGVRPWKALIRQERFVRFTSSLRQFDTLSETVTFHDIDVKAVGFIHFHSLAVRAPQTVTTPGGITVTLPAQPGSLPMQNGVFSYEGPGNETYVFVRVSPGGGAVSLPLSPLYQKHRLPVLVAVDGVDAAYADKQGDLLLRLPPIKDGVTHLDTLSLTITQTVVLQTIPLTFTVPVGPDPDQ